MLKRYLINDNLRQKNRETTALIYFSSKITHEIRHLFDCGVLNQEINLSNFIIYIKILTLLFKKQLKQIPYTPFTMKNNNSKHDILIYVNFLYSMSTKGKNIHSKRHKVIA